MWDQMLKDIMSGDVKSIARAISLVENEVPGYEELMVSLPHFNTPIIGITGPPGAGKSTLTDALIGYIIDQDKKVAVLCIDPSSPFNMGAVLGDRIRMSDWYNHPGVFIRSLATRGSLGGLHPHIIEITELLKVAPFDFIIVETVGVGQSEIEIVGLADVTTVVLVPEAGDEIQTMKAGLMEIADIFVVNKCDRPGADQFVHNLHAMLAPAFSGHAKNIPVIKTIAAKKQGIDELMVAINNVLHYHLGTDKKSWLLAERAYHLIERNRMKDINKQRLKEAIENLQEKNVFNLYKFVLQFHN
ncbi:methylmalonyl Co-A mutase-associated GTPase MeaB [Flavihumibacter profundi]|jgi:LAO/AO transport system kinase|uniref:methylmalonyl Co-A mutase-associated GTPase MeaB n=1 Tax=Flavihumibacter profundi TaxID=2716883 RepID=UPI001CC6E71C|nr:methylmalonyl Co-A mutase-associated GTPase MeaB [Flavihumibacter profundi]MBZ5858848.1 methylmalonyl Co-A mutase-associated GTPase MeaB [Flavihumibacter profundi]